MAVIDGSITGKCENTLLVATGDGSTLGDLSPECESGEGYGSRRFFFSPAGDLLVDPTLGETWVIEEASLKFRDSSDALNNQVLKPVAFASNGSRLVVGTAAGDLSVFRVAVLKGDRTGPSADPFDQILRRTDRQRVGIR